MRAKEKEKEAEDHLIEEVEEARIDLLKKDQSHTAIKGMIENLQDLKKGMIGIKDKIIKMKEIKNLLILKRNLEIKLQNMSNEKNINELESIKKENNELKEEILFYEKIVGKRKK